MRSIYKSCRTNSKNSRYNPGRGGHAPGHLRNALIDALDASFTPWNRAPWWKFLPGGKAQKRWLVRRLRNCSDIVPGSVCDALDLPIGRTFRQLVRHLRMQGEMMKGSGLKKFRTDVVAAYLKKQSKEPESLVRVLCERALAERQTLDRLRRELMRKLEKQTYPYPPVPGRPQSSFLAIIRSKGAVEPLLSARTLRELSSCLLIREVAGRYAEFSRAGRSEAGHPVEFHLEMIKALQGQIKRTRKLMRENGVPEEWANVYFEAVWAQIGMEARAVISYEKRGSLRELLHPHRSADVTTELAVYNVLKRCSNLPDRFLQQLAMLVSGTLEQKGAERFEKVEGGLRKAIVRQ
jgi:hypothetical protein